MARRRAAARSAGFLIAAISLAIFAIVFGIYALGFWMPQMVHAMGYTIAQTGFVLVIPYTASLAILWVIGVSSDRSGKRALHFIISALVCALGFSIAALGVGNGRQGAGE